MQVTYLRAAFIALAAVLPALHAAALDLKTDPNQLAAEVRGALPGKVAVGVLRGGVESFSETDAQPQLFEIGSISKVFTGLLLAQAVEKGELSLDDTLGKLLAGKAPLRPEVAGITLRQLVTHTSCLPRLPKGAWSDDMKDPYADVDRAMLWKALAETELKQPPPCEGEYSNYGVAVLGELLSERYAKPWETLVVERIAAPLGMSDTMQHLGAKEARLAKPYSGKREVSPWTFQAFAGAGSLRSTAPDMLRFSRAMLAGRNGPLGAAAERALQPLAKFAGGEIGYAVMMRGPADKRSYYHGGATGGYKAHWMILPDTQEAVIVLASNGGAPVEKVSEAVLAERYKLAATAAAAPPANPGEYAGVFRISPKLAMTVVAQDGMVYIRMTGQSFNAVTPSGADTFVLEKAGAEFAFARQDGKIASLTLRQRGNVLTGTLSAEAPPTAAKVAWVTKEAFAGHYKGMEGTDPLDFEVQADDGQMRIRLNRQPMLGVYPLPGKADRFAADVVAAEFQFERGEDKAVNAMVLHQNGKAIRVTREAAAP
ncbi:serine hydrolase domain-containing protein [Massilia endophytica]|uniref:serine hydrolase domain-containing protein n=1 Tax=Massilia endophytica TaxID=2899220 RepID=UPI001E44FED1|nr:serine hydrolase domain-containing protein [Massilia endophytica]UGQ48882.1 beta-lactamase family protein [Massilia endophytica]